MKSFFSSASIVLVLLACGGCARDIFATHNTPQDLQGDQHSSNDANNPAHGAPAATGTYAADEQGCNGRATQRMTMYDRPDTYPISQQERQDAYLSLYSECMREHNWQVAGPVRAPAAVASNVNVADLASLSPAAGGNGPRPVTVNAGNSVVSTTSVPGATVLVIGGNNATAAQLSSLSPSAGGAVPANATVIMVQPPQPAPVYAARPAAYYPPAAGSALPVAIPVAPASAYNPAPAQPQSAFVPTPHPTLAPANPIPGGQPSLAAGESNVTGSGQPPSSLQSNHQLETILDQ